jgi:hypothetical protein
LWQFAEILATTEHQAGIIYADLDYAQLEERRCGNPSTTPTNPQHYLYSRMSVMWQCTRMLHAETPRPPVLPRRNMPLQKQRRYDFYGLEDKTK